MENVCFASVNAKIKGPGFEPVFELELGFFSLFFFLHFRHIYIISRKYWRCLKIQIN